MGDHRFSFKATFEMHGIKRELNLGWCNWGAGSDGIDSRITDWIEKTRDEDFAAYDQNVERYFAKQRQVEAEKALRAEYDRLKAKFEPPTSTS